MSIYLREYGPGNPLVKTAQSLPQSATATLFTVSGTVLVCWMAGLVTTAVQNQGHTRGWTGGGRPDHCAGYQS